MIGKRSMRTWVALFGFGGAVLLLGGCEQQALQDADEAAAGAAAALTQDSVIPTGQACVPTGKHSQHGTFQCTTCHQCAGTLSFDPAIAGPNAAFDATTKNCSNVGCHAVPSGTFTYGTWDWGSDSMVYTTVAYGGQSGSGTANWYAAPGSSGCSACHGYPPLYNGVRYAWHSGTHGLGIGSGNACQLCHPDATGAYVYGGPPSYAGTSGGLIASCPAGTFCAAPGTITNGSRHGNGILDVTPAWAQACMNCH